MYPRTSIPRRSPAGLARGEKGSDFDRLPYIEHEDINEALRYAAYLAEDETLELAR